MGTYIVEAPKWNGITEEIGVAHAPQVEPRVYCGGTPLEGEGLLRGSNLMICGVVQLWVGEKTVGVMLAELLIFVKTDVIGIIKIEERLTFTIQPIQVVIELQTTAPIGHPGDGGDLNLPPA